MTALPAKSPNRFKNDPGYGAQLAAGYNPETTMVETVRARCVNCRWPLADADQKWCSVECHDEYRQDLLAQKAAEKAARDARNARLVADRSDPDGLHPHVVESMLLNPSLVRSVLGHLANGHSEERVAHSLLESARQRYDVVSLVDCRGVVMTVAETDYEWMVAS